MTDVEEAQRLADTATPGPWYVDGTDWDYNVHIGAEDTAEFRQSMPLIYDGDTGDPWVPGGTFRRRADAEFIAAARSLVPALVAEVESLRAEIAEADYACRVTGDKLVMVKEERDRFRAELGSYGPPETEWCIALEDAELLVLDAKTRADAENQLRLVQHHYTFRLKLSSCSVRRGPWVTTEKPENSQDLSTLEASEGVGSDG